MSRPRARKRSRRRSHKRNRSAQQSRFAELARKYHGRIPKGTRL